MVLTGCVHIASIHQSKAWTSESFEYVRLSACVHRLDLGLYSHPKEFWGNGVRNHVNSMWKITSTRKMLPRGGSNPQCCIKQDSKPSTLPTSYSGPQCQFKCCSPRHLTSTYLSHKSPKGCWGTTAFVHHNTLIAEQNGGNRLLRNLKVHNYW